ncbi:hypothetical protein ACIA8O_23185 [Kitasatospora sp. NPDC051853]|uniref:hypothetical protein n=1 Tax=Kitasatospora sp. NPDC051853 TaxID=3364058 RepID=UPI00379F18CB
MSDGTFRRRLLALTGAAALAAGALLTAGAPAQAANTYCAEPVQPGAARLGAGQTLTAGQSVNVAGETLVMQQDGNLVLRLTAPGNPSGPPLWHSNTWGNDGAYATMQADGNFVVYRQNGTALWSSGTYGHPGSCLDVSPRGDVQVTAPDLNYAPWRLDSGYCYCNPDPYGPKDRWYAQGVLRRANWMESNTVWLVIPPSGDLTLYRKRDNAVLWHSNTPNPDGAMSTAILQEDGNLVLWEVPPVGSPRHVGHTATWGNPGAYAHLQDDGNFVLYRQDGVPLWSTGTYGQV